MKTKYLVIAKLRYRRFGKEYEEYNSFISNYEDTDPIYQDFATPFDYYKSFINWWEQRKTRRSFTKFVELLDLQIVPIPQKLEDIVFRS